MNYAEIKNCDIANGPGVRVTLFVSGCTHHCEGCFNQETWDFQYGEPFTQTTQQRIIKDLAPDYIAGLTLLGGEPLEYNNWQSLLPLLREVKRMYPQKTIWCYTGYLFDKDILQKFCVSWKEMAEFLSYLDVIVSQKDISLQFRGSANQRIIAVQESLAEGKIIYWEEA